MTDYITTKIMIVIPKFRPHVLVYRTQASVYAIICETKPDFHSLEYSKDEHDGISEQKTTQIVRGSKGGADGEYTTHWLGCAAVEDASSCS